MTNTPKTAAAGVSVLGGDLNVVTASEVPYAFETDGPNGQPSGIWLKILGDHSDTVTSAVNVALDEKRKKDAVRAMKSVKSRPDHIEVTPAKEEIDFSRRMAAVRLVGWRGPGDTDGLDEDQLKRFRPIIEPYSAELALIICRTNPDYARQVLERAGELGNFMKVSPPTS